MEYIRQWKVGDQTFDNKTEAQKYLAKQELSQFTNVDDMIADADRVIALLKPFATPRTRKPRAANGTVAAKSKGKATQATAHA